MSMKIIFLVCFCLILVCTSCTDPYSNTTNPSSACTVGMDTCLSSYLRYPGGSFVIKQCTTAATCTSKTYGAFGYGFWLTCCTTDSCNSAVKFQNKTFLSLGVLFVYLLTYFKSI